MMKRAMPLLLLMWCSNAVAQNTTASAPPPTGVTLPGSALPGNTQPNSTAQGVTLPGSPRPTTPVSASVTAVAGSEIQITCTGSTLPAIDDKVDFLFKFTEFNEEVVVGSGTVKSIDGTTATVKFDPASGNKPKVGQRARIHASAPRTASISTPPPAVPAAPEVPPSSSAPTTPPAPPAMPAVTVAPPTPTPPTPPPAPVVPPSPPVPVGNVQRNFAQTFQRSLLQRPPATISSLGLYADNVPVEMLRALKLPPRSGAQIIGVMPGGPTAAAGLQKDDIVTKIDGAIIREGSIEWLPYKQQPGTKLAFTISRNLKTYVKEVTLGPALSDAEVLEKMRAHAQTGDPAAQMGYGGRLIRGVGAPANADEGMTWLTRAGEQELRKAQMMLGSIYFSKAGDGTALNEALKWFRRAADQGDAMSQSVLAGYYYEKQDYANALTYAKQAAEQSSEEGEFIYALMLLKGQAVKANASEGMKRLEAAANANHTEAMTALGAFYEEGKSMKRNLAKAREWYQKAAARGDPEAVARLKRISR